MASIGLEGLGKQRTTAIRGVKPVDSFSQRGLVRRGMVGKARERTGAYRKGMARQAKHWTGAPRIGRQRAFVCRGVKPVANITTPRRVITTHSKYKETTRSC